MGLHKIKILGQINISSHAMFRVRCLYKIILMVIMAHLKIHHGRALLKILINSHRKVGIKIKTLIKIKVGITHHIIKKTFHLTKLKKIFGEKVRSLQTTMEKEINIKIILMVIIDKFMHYCFLIFNSFKFRDRNSMG